VLGVPGVPGVLDLLGVSDNLTIIKSYPLEAAAGRETTPGNSPPDPKDITELRLEPARKGPQKETSGRATTYSIAFRTGPSPP
jgi:hypothetical protein